LAVRFCIFISAFSETSLHLLAETANLSEWIRLTPQNFRLFRMVIGRMESPAPAAVAIVRRFSEHQRIGPVAHPQVAEMVKQRFHLAAYVHCIDRRGQHEEISV
jgi:hypothetical protein